MYKSLFVLFIVGCVRAPWAPAASPGPLATRVVVQCGDDHHYTVGESGKFYLLRAITVPYDGYGVTRKKVHVEGQDQHDMPPKGQTIEVAGPAKISVVGCKRALSLVGKNRLGGSLHRKSAHTNNEVSPL